MQYFACFGCLMVKIRFKLKRRKARKLKQPKRNWLDLPSDIMVDILSRVGVVDILENAQKVCTAWYKICNDPAIWRVINIDCEDLFHDYTHEQVSKMCKHALDRSQGQLVDFTIHGTQDDKLLQYVADRASQLRYLKVSYCNDAFNRSWTEALKKFPLLEELSINGSDIEPEDIEAAGRYCPLLRTLKLNQFGFWDDKDIVEESKEMCYDMAVAIGNNLHELRHLELIGNGLPNTALEVILDGCPHLESLDLRKCLYLDLKGNLGKRCSKMIKYPKLPDDSFKGCVFILGQQFY